MSIVRKITIVVRGNTESDVEDAFNEAVERSLPQKFRLRKTVTK